jgi:hypothetical protein
MSDLLQQAMIDAAALREAAIKNAENALIEKYSVEFNQTVKKLLEQEAAAADPVATPPADPMAAAPADSASAAPADPMAAAPADSAVAPDLSAGASDPMATLTGQAAPTKKDAFSKVPGSFFDDGEDTLININFDQIRQTLNEMMGVKEEETVDEMYDMNGQDPVNDALYSEPEDDDNNSVVTIKISSSSEEEDESDDEEVLLSDEDELNELELEEDATAALSTAKARQAAANADVAKAEQAKAEEEADANKQREDDAKSAADQAAASAGTEAMEESIELSEEELQELAEELRVDLKVGNLSDGYMGSTETQKREQRAIELAAARDMKAEKERAEELEKMKDLMQENKHFKALNKDLTQALLALKEQLSNMNLVNAKLLYTNKALGNISLNERQKQQIVESISKADSVLAAKTIYETVQNAVENISKEKEAPQSLRETLNRAATPFVVKKSSANSINDLMAERMKALAGIKK